MRQVNLVDAEDKVIGQTDLLDAHRGDGKKHQAISLFMFRENREGEFELLLQQRSSKKIVGAMQWANTLCANLNPGEDHLICLKRRVFEELGFKWQANWSLKKAIILDYQVACERGFAENEIDHFFVSVVGEKEASKLKVLPNVEELADFVWLNWQIVKSKQIGDRALTPWLSLFLDKQEVVNKIDEVLEIWQKKN